jgi:hypothetical protein
MYTHFAHQVTIQVITLAQLHGTMLLPHTWFEVPWPGLDTKYWNGACSDRLPRLGKQRRMTVGCTGDLHLRDREWGGRRRGRERQEEKLIG